MACSSCLSAVSFSCSVDTAESKFDSPFAMAEGEMVARDLWAWASAWSCDQISSETPSSRWTGTFGGRVGGGSRDLGGGLAVWFAWDVVVAVGIGG